MRPIKSESGNNLGPVINIKAIGWGTLVTLVISLVLSILAGIVYYLSSLSEGTLSWMGYAILCISILAGGGYASVRAGAKGLYHGLGVGLLFFIIAWLIAGIILPGNIFLTGFMLKLTLALISGAAGGIIGVTFAS